jgi:transcription initiation factor TFIIH subunit 3
MNAVDATSRAVEEDTGAPPSLLTVILDTNPHAWNLLSPSLPLHKALASLLVFLNAHLAINPSNQVAVLASHVERAEWLYPTPKKPTHPSGGDTETANGGPVQQLSDEANKYRPFAAVERAITANLQALLAVTTPSNLTSTTTMTAGALTLALSHTSKLATGGGPTSTQSAQTTAFNYSDPNSGTSDSRGAAAGALSSLPGALTSRILILSASPDNSAQYIPTMNAIFAAQRLGIPIDVLTLASASTFLQQAADATGGIHLARTTPTSHAGLLQTLMLGFLPDPTARQNLILPAQASGSGAGSGVDFRAACFCHRRIVDVGFVCSICLSIFCKPVPDGTCLTCGSHLALTSYGQKPAVVPRKKKKRKRAATEANGVETPGSAGGTPAPP